MFVNTAFPCVHAVGSVIVVTKAATGRPGTGMSCSRERNRVPVPEKTRKSLLTGAFFSNQANFTTHFLFAALFCQNIFTN